MQAAFVGQSISPWWSLGCFFVAGETTVVLHARVIVTILVLMAAYIPFELITTRRNVIVTDRRILVLARSPWISSKARSIVRELPRNTRIAPITGMTRGTTALGERLFIGGGSARQIADADSYVFPGPSMQPPGPRDP